MIDNKGFHFIEFLDFIIKRKELFVSVFCASLFLSYISIYVFVDTEYEATATIIPREEDASSLASGLMSSIKKMPFTFGTKSTNSDMDMYKTIIYSRTMMEDVIRKFDLFRTYKLDTTDIEHMEKAIKRLRKEVLTKETEENAFVISTRANTPHRASDMTNYIMDRMNQKIVELNTSRSKENRIFLEQRIHEINQQLRNSEDSLRAFQERTGLLEIKSQLMGILEAHTTLETELAAKQVQLGIFEHLYNKESPQVRDLSVQVNEFQKKMAQLRSKGAPGSPILPLKDIPKAGAGYLRLFREVELNNLVLEFITPLYEQAKIEEKKDYPILQVIDYAIPPAKKSWPPRVIFSLIGAFSITILVYVFLRTRENLSSKPDSRLISLFHEMKEWNWKKINS